MSESIAGGLKPPSQYTLLSPRTSRRGPGPGEFDWAGRRWPGDPLHIAAVHGDVAQVTQLLDRGGRVDEPLVMKTSETAESRGEPLHLAASRGHIGVLQLLLDRRANLHAPFSFAVGPDILQWDVLQIAVLAERRGGDVEFVRSLLSMRCAVNRDGLGRTALTFAFEVGSVPLIRMLREVAAERGQTDLDDLDPVPLLVGIQKQRLTQGQLVQSASIRPGCVRKSLEIFFKHRPQCIPMFMRRVRNFSGKQVLPPSELASLVTTEELVRVLGTSPRGAVALLDELIESPEATSYLFHPVPNRVSFASECIGDMLDSWVNDPAAAHRAIFAPDRIWDYDFNDGTFPEWHKRLQGPASPGGPLVREVKISVLEVANIICPEVFMSLVFDIEPDALGVFESPAICKMVNAVWDDGAHQVDAHTFLVTMWGLALLVLQCCLEDSSKGSEDHSTGDDKSSAGAGALGQAGVAGVLATSFVATRAVVDVAQELIEFRGTWRLGQSWRYLTLGKVTDIVHAGIPMLGLAFPGVQVIQALIILIYWWRLVEVNLSDGFAKQLLPIKELWRSPGIMPASVLAAVMFLSTVHCSYFLDLGTDENARLWPDVFLNCFGLLFSGSAPTDFDNINEVQLCLAYMSVLIFTVYFLNIFIGVIGENFAVQQSIASMVFKKKRAKMGLTYMLRASCVPCFFGQRCTVVFATWLLISVALAIQCYMLVVGRVLPWVCPSIFLCQLGIAMLGYQRPNSTVWWSLRRWASGLPLEEPHYLWFTSEVLEDEREDTDEGGSAGPVTKRPFRTGRSE